MYFLETKNRWSPGLDKFIRASETSDSECLTSDSAPSSEYDGADLIDDVMDLEIPMHLESPEVVQNMLGFSDLKQSPKFTINELESVLKDMDYVAFKSMIHTNYSNVDYNMYDMVSPNDIFNIKTEPVEKEEPMNFGLDYINPLSENCVQRVPPSSGFSFAGLTNALDSKVPENIFAEELNSDLSHENTPALVNALTELSSNEETFLNELNITEDFEINEELLSCVERDFNMGFEEFVVSTDDIMGATREMSNESQPVDYMSDEEDCVLTNDPFIGVNGSPKKQTSINVIHRFVTSDSTKEQMSVIKEVESDIDIHMFTHSYCKYVKKEPVVPKPSSPVLDSQKYHSIQPEQSVSHKPTPVIEEAPVPVKRRPGRPRKSAPVTDPREKISVCKSQPIKKPKRTTQPPAKKAKLTLKSPACNEKRLQHNELERNRRDAMRQSMEGVEHRIPDRILQLTQLALYHERNEKSEEIENNFTVEVFRHVEDLLKNKDNDLKNVKCRKVNTKKGTRFPKMVVLLSAAFYVTWLERDIKSKEHLLKKNEHILRHSISKPTKRLRKY